MDKIGNIEINVFGRSGNRDLKPDNYDIRQIGDILRDVEDILYPNNKKNRPLITYNISEGSVRHLFKTPVQYVIAFSAILTQIQHNESIDFLDLKTARAIENIQTLARRKDYEFQFSTSITNNTELSITPSTNFFKAESTWVDAEFYFYGVLKDAGGKNKANIHLDTEDYGYLTIETAQSFLMGQEEDMLYKEFGVRAAGKQDVETGEVDTKSLRLIEFIDYNSKFDELYLSSLIAKAKQSWKGINTADWLSNIRGEYEV